MVILTSVGGGICQGRGGGGLVVVVWDGEGVLGGLGGRFFFLPELSTLPLVLSDELGLFGRELFHHGEPELFLGRLVDGLARSLAPVERLSLVLVVLTHHLRHLLGELLVYLGQLLLAGRHLLQPLLQLLQSKLFINTCKCPDLWGETLKFYMSY